MQKRFYLFSFAFSSGIKRVHVCVVRFVMIAFFQPYRHVDNIVFENPFLVERFLNYWRCTGHQRVGILYGFYEPHKDVPLGIKATVTAIYEPPQVSIYTLIYKQQDMVLSKLSHIFTITLVISLIWLSYFFFEREKKIILIPKLVLLLYCIVKHTL